MNIDLNREMIAQLAIIIGVCVGGWMMLVEPSTTEIRKLEAEIRTTQAETVGRGAVDIEAAAARVREVFERLEQIRAGSELAENSSQLYGRIKELAARHDVVVHRLRPGADTGGNDDDGIGVSRIDVSVEGAYPKVIGFLEAIDRMEGFIRPGSLRIDAVRRPGGIVSARAAYEVLSFEIGENFGQEALVNADA